MVSVLAQRAASEGPRWTCAVEDQQPPSLKRERASLEGVSVTALDRCNWSNMDALPGCDNWRTWKNICPTLIAGSSAQLLPL